MGSLGDFVATFCFCVISKTRFQASFHFPVLTNHLTCNFQVSMFGGTDSACMAVNRRRTEAKEASRRARLMRRLKDFVECNAEGESK